MSYHLSRRRPLEGAISDTWAKVQETAQQAKQYAEETALAHRPKPKTKAKAQQPSSQQVALPPVPPKEFSLPGGIALGIGAIVIGYWLFKK